MLRESAEDKVSAAVDGLAEPQEPLLSGPATPSLIVWSDPPENNREKDITGCCSSEVTFKTGGPDLTVTTHVFGWVRFSVLME